MSKDNHSSHRDMPKSNGSRDSRSMSSNRTMNQIVSSKTWLLGLFQRIQSIANKIARMLSSLGQLVSSWSKVGKRFSAISALVIATILAGHAVSAQIINPTPSQPLASLKTVSIPEPDNLKDFVKDKTAAIALGKSLFWDMQLGSDGIQSCASCHFHAGADNRSKNQLNPGLLRVNADRSENPDKTFTPGRGPNYQLTAADYPFHKLADPNNRSSTVVADSNDVTGSQGVFRSKYVDVSPGNAEDIVQPLKDDVFNVNGTNVRQVTSRNSPTTINAVFNFRNFWDGRAQNIFNGVNEFGLRDPNAFVLKANKKNELLDVRVSLKNSSLASQAVGPPLSAFETATESLPVAPLRAILSDTGEVKVLTPSSQEVINNSSGAVNVDSLSSTSDDSKTKQLKPSKTPKPLKPLKRVGRKLGKKLTVLRPLGKQLVATDDSVLGSYSRGYSARVECRYVFNINPTSIQARMVAF